MQPRCLALAVLLAAVLLLGLPAPAQADDWSDARGEFRSWMKSERWQERATAYQLLLDFDGGKAFQECLGAALKEKNAAVVLAAIKTLGQFDHAEARALFVKELKKPRGEKGALLLMAAGLTKGDVGVPELIAVLGGKDEMQAGLAANALAEKRAAAALPHLLDALGHKAWQVASASARALTTMAWSDKTQPSKKSGKQAEPKMPAWFDVEKVLWPLIDKLETAQGTLRGDLIEALEKITRKDYGDNWAAWVAHARGQDVTEELLEKREHPAYFFGIPVYGRRIVVVMDASVLTENVHPFTKRERLQELCKVPGGRDVPWFKIQSIKQFVSAWVTRFLSDLPAKSRSFDLIFSGQKPGPVFGKLQGLNPGSLKKALAAITKLPAENDNDILSTMTSALDISGSKDSAAWNKGPDLILCVYASIPWRAEVTDPEVVGATVGLKARRRQVKVHAVGVHEFAYNMMKLFSGQSGGRYVALSH